jgi:hypothetical protein
MDGSAKIVVQLIGQEFQVALVSWIGITTKTKTVFPDLVFSSKPEKIEDMLQFQLARKLNFEFAMKVIEKN